MKKWNKERFATIWEKLESMIALRSLRARIFLLTLVIGLVPCIAMRHGIVSNYEDLAVEQRTTVVQNQLMILANHLISNNYLSSHGVREDTGNSREVINAELEMLSNLYEGRVMIINKNFKVEKDTYGISEGKTIISEEVIKCFQGENISHYDPEHGYIEMTTPIMDTTANTTDENGKRNPDAIRGVMLTSISNDSIVNAKEVLNRKAYILEVIMMVAILALAIILSRALTRPFNRVTQAINAVKEGFSDETISVPDYVETVHIVDAFNQLLKRMKALDDSRQEFVANNTEILTTLFEKEMQNYIYQEATELVQIESQLAGNVRLTIITMCAAILVATAILLRRSFRLTYSITKPISEILHNIKKVGKGEYKTINVVSADSVEIQELDAGTRKMAGRIEGLLENVRKEQEVQHMTELQLIQAQVNPHFLYNTLDTIVWLVEGGMQQDAVDMITSLSVFFRTSLSKGKDIIPLSEEKRHTLSYLEIQQSRYRDIMEFEINIPPELDEVMVLKLTLQPLAENALYHGIKNKRGKGKILIEGFNLGDDMMLRVTDNGQGMTPERLYEVQEAIRTGERAGSGLAAVSERIVLYYGPGYGLKISSTEGEGTVMEVYMAKKINLDNNSR